MVHLWKKNRTAFVKSSWLAPKELLRKRGEDFKKFKERTLNYFFNGWRDWPKKKQDKAFFSKFPGRRVNLYKMFFSEGGVRLKITRVLVPKKQVVNGRLTDEMRAILPIKCSRTCLYRGTVPFPVGFRPQKVYGQSVHWLKYLKEKKKGAILWKDPERVEIEGSWPSQIAELQAMADPVPHTATYESIRESLRTRLAANMVIPVLRAPRREEVYVVGTNQKAFSGVMTSRTVGATHKKADPVSRQIAYNLFDKAGKSVVCDNSLWGICGRSRYQKYEPGSPCRSRLILAPEAHEKIFALTYAQQWYNILPTFVRQRPHSACQIGLNFQYNGMKRYSEAWESFRNFEADLKRHDQHVTEEFMVAAFSIIRSAFPKSREIDRHFLHFMSGTIFKNVVVPGRFIFRILKGNPSGTPFTSLLSTFANVLQWGCTFVELYKHQASLVHLGAYGDDTIGKLHIGAELHAPEVVAEAHLRVTGNTVSPFKYKNWHARHPEDRPVFLKTYPLAGSLPARTVEDAIFSMANSRGQTFLEIAQTCTSLCYTSPFNMELTELALDYRDWLRGKALGSGDELPGSELIIGERAKALTIGNAFMRFALEPLFGLTVTKPRLPWMEGQKETCGVVRLPAVMLRTLRALGFKPMKANEFMMKTTYDVANIKKHYSHSPAEV